MKGTALWMVVFLGFFGMFVNHVDAVDIELLNSLTFNQQIPPVSGTMVIML